MTDYELVAMEKVDTYFRHHLASLVGDCLAQMPIALESEVLSHLNSRCSVYKVGYDKRLPVKRINWGTDKETALSYKGVSLDFTEAAEEGICVAAVPDFLSL